MEVRVWWLVTMVDKKETALLLARGAVDGGLAACAQIEGPVLSVYKWQEDLHEDPEYRVVFKTGNGKRKQLVAWLEDKHPYEVPEILGWPTPEAMESYAKWVMGS